MGTESKTAIAMDTRETPTLHANPTHGLLVEALIWFVWLPASLVLLFFVLEHFILAEALF
jgi:hypothetical protein